MECFVYVLLLLLLKGPAEGVKIINITNDDAKSLSSPNPYPPYGNQTFIVSCETGYLLLVTIDKISIDGGNGDFLLVKSGTSMDEEGTGRIFTHHLDKVRQFISLTNSVLINFVVYGTNKDNRDGFAITIERHGEPPTTTVAPTTGITWPTPSVEDSIYLTVNISGRTARDYMNEEYVFLFQKAVAEMAREYCEVNNFWLSEEITFENVHINQLTECPLFWPNRHNCVQITFALPIFLSEQLGYQLTTSHLQVMWNTLAANYLSLYRMEIYDPPDSDLLITLWLSIICCTILLFGIMLYVAKVVGVKFGASGKKKTELNKTDDRTEEQQRRTSRDSLGPHRFQSVPTELFNTSYETYEPLDLTQKHFNRQTGGMDNNDDMHVNFTNFDILNSEHHESNL